MATEKYCLPKVSYGWLPEYNDLGQKIILRQGQWLAMLPRMADRTNAHYFSVGITHLIQNVGQIETSVDRTKRAVMHSFSFVPQALNSVNYADEMGAWTEANINAAIDAHYNDVNNQTAFVIDQIAEWLTDHGGATGWNGTIASERFGRRMQIALERNGLGGRFYGGYDGHMDAGRAIYGLEVAKPDGNFKFFTIENLRNILNWSEPINGFTLEESINLLSAFGNDFYSGNAHIYRHGAIKIYGKGDPNIYQMTMGFVLSLEVDRKIREKKNISRRVVVIPFSGYNEDVSEEHWSVRYQRSVRTPSGGSGTVTRTTFPMWSYSLQIGIYFLALAMDFDLYSWESEERFGRDPDVIAKYGSDPNAYGKDKYNISTVEYTGASGVLTAQPANSFTANAVMYPANPQGCLDLPLVAADMYTFVNQYGGFNGQWASHRVIKSNGATPYTVLKADYLVDRYQSKEGLAMVFVSGNKAAIFYQNMYLPAYELEVVEVKLQPNGPTHQFDVYGGTPYCCRVDL